MVPIVKIRTLIFDTQAEATIISVICDDGGGGNA